MLGRAALPISAARPSGVPSPPLCGSPASLTSATRPLSVSVRGCPQRGQKLFDVHIADVAPADASTFLPKLNSEHRDWKWVGPLSDPVCLLQRKSDGAWRSASSPPSETACSCLSAAPPPAGRLRQPHWLKQINQPTRLGAHRPGTRGRRGAVRGLVGQQRRCG